MEKLGLVFSKSVCCLSDPGTTLVLHSQIHISKSNASVINILRGWDCMKNENSALSVLFRPLICFMCYPFYK